MTATIGLLGDVMLGRKVAERVAEVGPRALWSEELAAVCSGCDAVVCNLECCLSAGGAPTDRVPHKPFFFRAPPSATDALAAVRVRVASLANNHALDYGEQALLDTLDHLGHARIGAVGAGPALESARRGAVFAAGALRIGVVALTDHPVQYAARPDSPGVAWADLPRGLPGWVRGEIAHLRDEADLVVAFPHWGPNMTTRPAGWQRRRARELMAAGADLVAGHSAHVFHGIERAPGGPILYDLGDALDDYAVDDTLRNDLGILVLWRPRSEPELELVALRLGFGETAVARGADADWIVARLTRACRELGTEVHRVSESRLVL
jgi:poly-gamma-glutamate capsule biosynthesis protein CapA/YwtB (metallophosphatase superfamily)